MKLHWGRFGFDVCVDALSACRGGRFPRKIGYKFLNAKKARKVANEANFGGLAVAA